MKAHEVKAHHLPSLPEQQGVGEGWEVLGEVAKQGDVNGWYVRTAFCGCKCFSSGSPRGLCCSAGPCHLSGYPYLFSCLLALLQQRPLAPIHPIPSQLWCKNFPKDSEEAG